MHEIICMFFTMTRLHQELLQISVGKRDRFSHNPTIEEWLDLKAWAESHAIIGFSLMGIERLTKEQKPPSKLLINWIVQTEMIRETNQKQIGLVHKLFERLEVNGSRCCLLKGLGSASYYPNALIRQNGDFDVWMDGDRKDITRMVKDVMPDVEISWHHIDYPSIGGVPVEIHFMPAYLINPFNDKKMRQWWANKKEEQFNNRRSLYDGDNEKLCVPTTDFNFVFLLAHMYKHFLYEGFGMRHLVDYYYVMKEYFQYAMRGEISSQDQTVVTIKEIGLEKFCRGVMWIMKDWFRMEEDLLLMQPDEKEGRFIMGKVEESGNFGIKHGIRSFMQRKLWLLGMLWHYPSDVMWSIPHSCIYRYQTWRNR